LQLTGKISIQLKLAFRIRQLGLFASLAPLWRGTCLFLCKVSRQGDSEWTFRSSNHAKKRRKDSLTFWVLLV